MESIESIDIRVGKIWYPVTTLGYGKRLGVWLQGCGHGCVGCISPELQPRSGGRVIKSSEIVELMKEKEPVDGMTISGGEPFDQPEGLLSLVRWFAGAYGSDILIYTGYTLEQLHAMRSPVVESILAEISVLVDGRYEEKRNDGLGLRGSSNQKIYIWKNPERYKDVEKCNRSMQCVFLRDRIWMIGIPPGPE